MEPNSGDDQDENVPTTGFQSMEPVQNCPLRYKGSGFMQRSDQHVVPSSEVKIISFSVAPLIVVKCLICVMFV